MPEPAFYTALMAIKRVFPEQALVVGASERWSRWEEKGTMDLAQACMEYYLSGVGPEMLAETLLNFFPEIRSGILSGDIKRNEFEGLRTSLAGYLLDFYPPQVKERYAAAKRK